MQAEDGEQELQVANSPGKQEAGESGGQRLGSVKGASLPRPFLLLTAPQWLPSLQNWETLLISRGCLLKGPRKQAAGTNVLLPATASTQ